MSKIELIETFDPQPEAMVRSCHCAICDKLHLQTGILARVWVLFQEGYATQAALSCFEKLEITMTEPTLHYTDEEKIRRLSAWHESEKAEIATLRTENARLNEDSRLADMAWKDNQAALKAQAAQIEELRQTVHTAYGHTCPLEDCKSLICSSTNG